MLLSRKALGLLRGVRMLSSTEHSTGAHGHHDKPHHDAAHGDQHDHGHAEHHDDHHGHAPEDPDYFYNKYGPFHHYTFLNQCRPEDIHNVDSEDPYRNEVQGYMFTEDPSDSRKEPIRGVGEALLAFTVLLLILYSFPLRHFSETDNVEKKVAEALITAQFIERYLKEHKAKE